MNSPDLMIVHELAIHIDRAIGETVGPLIERTVGLQKAAMVKLTAGGIGRLEFHPRLI